LLFGFRALPPGEVPELVKRRVHADESELGLDRLEIKLPDVGENALHPASRMVPSLARGPGAIATAPDRD